MPEYSSAFKANLVKKLMVPGGPTASLLSHQTGISQPTLSRWLRDAREGAMSSEPKIPKVPSSRPRRPADWKPEEKLRVVVEAEGLGPEELGELLRREGIHDADRIEWRRAVIAALGTMPKAQPVAAETRRVRELERELARKEKALAETAALLVLKKKAHEYWGDEDEGTKKETEK